MTTPQVTRAALIAAPFPTPPGGVMRALDVLRQPPPAATSPTGRAAVLPDRGDGLARPWSPNSCPAEMRRDMWVWCEAVAEWINREYCWRPDTMIPACWPAHPHIARELAALAVQRWIAETSRDVTPLEVWHRDSYPGFCNRMTQRLGESTCRSGRHIDWPADPRHTAYLDSQPRRLGTITRDWDAGTIQNAEPAEGAGS